MILFHTDLDNTLIYSYKYDIGTDTLCVENDQGKKLSFITRETFRLLQEVQKQVVVVPTTTRTEAQYHRIHLGQNDFHYALVCNGGVLLVDGREEESWYRKSLDLIQSSRKELNKALDFLKKDKRRSFELRFIRELFVFTKCEEPELVALDLKKRLDEKVVDVFHQGVKLYVVPKILDKGNAVNRFRKYIGADYVIAAGDSEMDSSMLEAADLGIAAPELAKIHPFSEKVKCLSAEKLYAEAVLETVLWFSADRR